MIEKIESLRKKPPHVRNRYAFWIALCLTTLIVIFWATTLPGRFASIESKAANQKDVSREIGISKSLAPFITRAQEAFSALVQQPEATTTVTVPIGSTREDIDFQALLASSTMQDRLDTEATTTATSTAATSSAQMEGASSVPSAALAN